MKHVWIYALVLGLLLAACGRQPPIDPGNPARELSGTVASWEGGAAELEAVAQGEEPLESRGSLATGTLAADGSFSLTLPETVPAGSLTEGGINDICEGGEFTGAATPQSWQEAFAGIVVSQGGEPVGVLSLASSQDTAGFVGGEAGDFIVSHLFVDRDVTLQGECVSDFGTFTLDATLREGWNLVVLVIEELSEEGFPSRLSGRSVTSVPAGAQWYFVAAEDLLPPQEPSTVMTGLNTPTGVLADAQGNVWAIDSGLGGDEELTTVPNPYDGEPVTLTLGNTSRVVRTAPDGTQEDAAFLPSVGYGEMGATGGSKLALLNGTLYATVGEWEEWFGGEPPMNFAAVVRIENGALSQVANLWALEQGENPDGEDVHSNPYGITAGPDGRLYVTDAGANTLLRVDPATGEVVLIAVFDPVTMTDPESGEEMELQAVPTGVAVGEDGSLYVSFFHGGVSRVTLAGEVSDYAPGFLLTDLATGPDGALYAVQIAELGEEGPVPESGKVLRILEGGSEVVLEGLSFNARGDAFVALNIFGPPGSGEVVRFPRLTAQPGEARVGVQALPALGNLASLAWSLGVR